MIELENQRATGRDFVNTAHSERDFTLYQGNIFAEEVFGDADARNEWNMDSFKSSDTFVHTESYADFKKSSALFLLGRRGTGKTAMMRMLDYEINSGKTKEYQYASIVLQEEAYPKLTRALRGEAFSRLTRDEIRDTVKDKWSWIIYTSAMLAVYWKDFLHSKPSDDFAEVYHFLKQQNLLFDEDDFFAESPLQKALATLEGELAGIDYNPLKVGMAIYKSMQRLLTVSYKKALNALVKYLSTRTGKVVVLLDSKETYQYNDYIFDSVTAALMDCVLDVFSKSSKTHIYAKVAFPSEMYTHFTPENVGKTLGKTHFIMWRYKDIVNLIAKRYYKLLVESNLSVNGYKYNDFETYQNSKTFMASVLPATVETYSGIRFDALPYIIGHTQKKPRQVIQMFNLILTLAQRNGMACNELTEDCVREGANMKLEILTDEAFDIYSRIFPSATEIVRKTFKNSRNIFRLKDLHVKLQESSGLLARGGLDREMAERLFLECGLLGVFKKETPIADGKTMITAQYEYQVKDIIAITNSDLLVVHPMFYQPLGILADNNSMVYPMPTEHEQEEMEHLHTH